MSFHRYFRPRVVGFCCAIALLMSACSGTGQDAPSPTPPQAAEIVAAVRAGNGFTCVGDARRMGCACEKGATERPRSCDGLAELCRRNGADYTCEPDDWCGCGWVHAIR
jgi:hypothetical protein